VELLGQYETGAGEEPRYLYRLGDGEAVQVTRLMHLVASRLDGSSVGVVARQVTDEVGRRLSPDNVTFLIDQKLRPLGLVSGAAGDRARPTPATPLLGLRFRGALVPAGVVRRLAALLRPLFLPPVLIAVLVAFVATDLWLFLGHGVSGGVRDVVGRPILVPVLWGAIVLAGFFHELGHATACHYGGGRPGRLGVGLYLVWPVFYSDVTDSYRLSRSARLRTDLGGLYFNVIVVLASAAAYAGTGWEFLLVLIAIQHMTMLLQLVPFVRLDGYYVVSDLVGVPDLFSYVKPIVTSVVLRRAPHPAVADLGKGARRVVTVWVLVTIPVLATSFGLLAVKVPEWSALTAESVTVQLRLLREAIDAGRVAAALAPALQTVALVLPLVGISLTLLLATVRAAHGFSRWTRRDVQLEDERKEDDSVVNEEVKGVRTDGAAAERAGPPIEEQADELLQSVAQTVEAAMQVLRSARTVRARAEEEAEAIRAAARRDAAELLARTRTGVQTLLHELSRDVDANSDEVPAAPSPTGATFWSPPPSAEGLAEAGRAAGDVPVSIAGGRRVELAETGTNGSPDGVSGGSPVAALGGGPTSHLQRPPPEPSPA
jgi:putative peptide zinc metalloprotease protein